MRIRRGFLFWGLFLIPLGAVPLFAQAGVIEADSFSDIWRWWPLLLIGLGVALLLGRGQASLIGTAVIALVLGTLGGSFLASGNIWVGSLSACGPGGDTTVLDRDGTFSGDASVTMDLDCGEVDITVEPGSSWRAHAEYTGGEPRIDATGSGLALRTPDDAGLHRQDWTVALGADAVRTMDLDINAASVNSTLSGASLSRLDAHMNAGELRIDGSGASIGRIDASVNAGSLRVTLEGGTTGDLSANAGSIELCVPPGVPLQLDVEDQFTFATNLAGTGLTRDGETWTRSGSGESIDLSVEGNAASFTLDPEGGCK